jgi:two-component system nitrogen regulation sensor histidine kinase NtrY
MTADQGSATTSRLGRSARWAAQVGLSRKLAIGLTAAALVSGLATYAALTGSMSPAGADPTTILALLNVDLVLLLLLGALVAWRMVRLWIERRQGSAGARLHARMVGMFSIVAVTPAIIVAVFSATFFNLGVQSWFNERVRTALERSLAVSEAYLQEHRNFIRADILSMVATINRQPTAILESPDSLSRLIDGLATERSLAEAIILRGDGKVLARSKLSFVLEFDPLANAALQRAAGGQVVIMTSDASDRVRALTRIDSMLGAFLYIGRFVDATVLNHMTRLSAAVSDYQALESRRSGIQITFTLLYVTVALMLLFAAVWMGLVFANRIIRPISALVGATERVRAGDLTVRVVEEEAGDEIAALSVRGLRGGAGTGPRRAHLPSQPLGARPPRLPAARPDRAASRRGGAGDGRADGQPAHRQARPDPGQGVGGPRRPRARAVVAHRRAGRQGPGRRLRGHFRRHHRARICAARRRLDRRRAPHRP